MSETIMFNGFSKETFSFFRRLKRNNTKVWFDDHKQEYEQHVLEPAKAFVTAFGTRIREKVPGIIADPKINRSIFRIYRDTRFSPDKTPYKTHLGLFLWEGGPSRMECPGFYIQLEPAKILLGAGLYQFSAQILRRFRKAIVDPDFGSQLADIIQRIEKTKNFQIGGRHYKRIPFGYDAQHPNAPLLLHKGLHLWQEAPLPDDVFSPALVQYCWVKFRHCIPLHQWLVALMRWEP